MYKSYKPHTVCRVCVCVCGGGGVMTVACWASTSPDALVELCIRPTGGGGVCFVQDAEGFSFMVGAFVLMHNCHFSPLGFNIRSCSFV